MLFHKKINEVTLSNDIKYKAPLSYRHFRILGWLMLVLGQAGLICASAANIIPTTRADYVALYNASDILGAFGSLSICLFLLANFAIILSSRQSIKKVMLFHGLYAVLLYSFFALIYCRYILGISGIVEGGKETAEEFIYSFFAHSLSINVFVDLLVCSSFYFFLIYDPKKIFIGWKKILFRLMAIIPILYEIASILLKGLSVSSGYFTLPVMVLPLLATKPTMTFVAFIAITLFVFFRKHYYFKKGGTEEQYEEFLKTNYNTFSFDVYVAIVFLICGIIDLILSNVFTEIFKIKYPYIDIESRKGIKELTKFVYGWGFGKATAMAVFSPFVLLFSYTKKHSEQSKKFDILIPIIGIAAVVLTYIEGYYDIIIATLGK